MQIQPVFDIHVIYNKDILDTRQEHMEYLNVAAPDGKVRFFFGF